MQNTYLTCSHHSTFGSSDASGSLWTWRSLGYSIFAHEAKSQTLLLNYNEFKLPIERKLGLTGIPCSPGGPFSPSSPSWPWWIWNSHQSHQRNDENYWYFKQTGSIYSIVCLNVSILSWETGTWNNTFPGKRPRVQTYSLPLAPLPLGALGHPFHLEHPVKTQHGVCQQISANSKRCNTEKKVSSDLYGANTYK